MYEVLRARTLAPAVRELRIAAPRVARHRRPGQFVIVRAATDGERIPLTISDADSDAGWIALIVQGVGKTTKVLNLFEAGDALADVVGPLGTPSEIGAYGTAVVIGGGVGTAIAYPTARALAGAGNRVIAVIGGRSREFVILEDELRAVADEVHPVTDDGSYGERGLVTDVLRRLLDEDTQPGLVLAIGPIPMMAAVADLTRPDGIRTVVSLNPIMVDGTGMCGGCRVRVGGETRFVCVDGPEFDAHQVDFELLARRNAAYRDFERRRDRQLEACLTGEPGDVR